MRIAQPLLLALAVILLPAALNGPTLMQKSEARLAKLLKGRAPGKPVDCIHILNRDKLETYEFVGLVYKDGDTIYLSRAKNRYALRRGFAPVIGLNGYRLCYYEIGQTVSLDGLTARTAFSPFVPFTKRP